MVRKLLDPMILYYIASVAAVVVVFLFALAVQAEPTASGDFIIELGNSSFICPVSSLH